MSFAHVNSNYMTDYLNIFEKNKNLFELGNSYEKLNEHYKAIVECYIIIIQTDSQNGVVLNQIGVCYSNLGQYKLAIHYFKKVLKIKEIPDVYCNVGLCYEKIKEYDLAKINFMKAYYLDNDNSRIKSAIANIYYILKFYDKAIKYYNKIKDFESNAKEKYNSSFSYLAKQEFERGFDYYECRLEYNNINHQTKLVERLEIPFLKLWNGKDNCNKLLIVSEQGLGDNIQYYRFIIELSELYPEMVIHYFCKKQISHIFNVYDKIEIIDNVIVNNENNPFMNYDYKVYIMSLPKILNLKIILPNKINYIKTDETLLDKWKLQFLPLKKYKVGFVYNGLLNSFIEKYIPLLNFEILFDLDIDLICIHKKSDIEHDISNIPDIFKERIQFFEIDNEVPFLDTIHILQNIDLLITIDTYIVHLAGIMNVKTWLLLGCYSEWRWSNEESHTYWYNSVELVRMKEKQELKNILKTVKNKLVEFLEKR